MVVYIHIAHVIFIPELSDYFLDFVIYHLLYEISDDIHHSPPKPKLACFVQLTVQDQKILSLLS